MLRKNTLLSFKYDLFIIKQSATRCRYDYIIMDEASQVSLRPELILSCAKNAIIVGDTTQLPNGQPEENKEKLNFIANACLIKPEYDCALHKSFCNPSAKVIPNTPIGHLYRRPCYGNIIDAILESSTSVIRNFMVEILSS